MSEIKVNKVSPATGTAIQLGDSGDTFTVPSGATIVNSGTATGFGGGKVLQVLNSQYSTETSTTNAIPWDDTIPQSSEGLELTTINFTPVSATSTFYCVGHVPMSCNTSILAFASLFMDSETDAFASMAVEIESGGSYSFDACTVMGTYASTGTSARTLKLRGGAQSGVTIHFNDMDGTAKFGGKLFTTLRLMEVEA